ncbi:hypothetical protein [Rothia sp. ZJ932]|uniref:hypothetical protein n=1 Tax=Rothia sp. ZJ932 TaxID=2810516 RepID=UPI00196867F5|nr:hypothetical protein [Rothia sp. ZJ932]QRZ61789.1 hypothetical protein JR346_01205 [Rothia sp. ZJ932]
MKNLVVRMVTLKNSAVAAFAVLFSVLNVSAASAIDFAMELPPGLDRITVVLGWIMAGVGLFLLIQFMLGIGSAGRARSRGEEAVEPPLKPAIAGAFLLGVPTIWTLLTGL